MAHLTTSKPGPDTVYHEAGSQAAVQDLIAAQDRARQRNAEKAAKKWAPWIVGGLLVGGAVWWWQRES